MSHRRNFIKQLGMGASVISLSPSDLLRQVKLKNNTGKPRRILFQGDSITDGGRWKNSNDWNHFLK